MAPGVRTTQGDLRGGLRPRVEKADLYFRTAELQTGARRGWIVNSLIYKPPWTAGDLRGGLRPPREKANLYFRTAELQIGA